MSAFELRQLPPPGGPVVARESLQRAIAARLGTLLHWEIEQALADRPRWTDSGHLIMKAPGLHTWRPDKVDTMVAPVWPELPL